MQFLGYVETESQPGLQPVEKLATPLKIVLGFLRQTGNEKQGTLRKSSLTSVQKLVFHLGTLKKNTIVLVHAIKTSEFKYRVYSTKHRGPDNIKIERR